MNAIKAAASVQPNHDPLLGEGPVMFWDTVAPDGDALPWKLQQVGSFYFQIDDDNRIAKVWIKRKDNQVDNDWCIQGGVHCLEKTVTRSMFTDGGSTSGTYTLTETVPQGAFVYRTILDAVTGFTGDTSAVIIVGDGTDTDRYNTGTPSVFTTANAIDLGAPSGTQIHTAAKSVTITITSAADFTNVSAGQLTIKLFYFL